MCLKTQQATILIQTTAKKCKSLNTLCSLLLAIRSITFLKNASLTHTPNLHHETNLKISHVVS